MKKISYKPGTKLYKYEVDLCVSARRRPPLMVGTVIGKAKREAVLDVRGQTWLEVIKTDQTEWFPSKEEARKAALKRAEHWLESAKNSVEDWEKIVQHLKKSEK